MDDQSFKIILEYFDLSWQGYRRVRKGVKKRIARHMQEMGLRGVTDCLDFLRQNPKQSDRLRVLLAVSISRFFRDLHLWEVLDRLIIPDLLASPVSPIRAWVAGCACGEEVYSLKILWDQKLKSHARMPMLQVWASDLNALVLEKAKIGIYSSSSLREVRGSIRDDYFYRSRGDFAVAELLKRDIQWTKHDVAAEKPPGEDFDIIFLRNSLLTYYLDPDKTRSFGRVVEALREGGYLIVGNNEEVPAVHMGLRNLTESRCVFVKLSSSGNLYRDD